MKQVDVLVLGSGAAGLSAAITAAECGLTAAVFERALVFGGTSAISGGALWIPMTRQAIAGGFPDSIDAARTYLQHVTGEAYRADIIDAFLVHGPEALAFLEQRTPIRYSVRTLSPDYHPDLPGATDRGRSLEVGEFDGRRLGPYFELLRSPPRGMMGMGGMMVNRPDIAHFLSMRRSLRSFLHISRLALRFWIDRLRHSRGTRLVIGNGMIAALLRAALDKGVELHRGVETEGFRTDPAGRVCGVVARLQTGEVVSLEARGGVVLATGGLSRRNGVLEDRPDTREDHVSMAAPLADGSMMARAVRDLGAGVGDRLRSNFYWAPMSIVERPDGTVETFPHIVTDRAKPGIIAITDRGVRFVNEAQSYHLFVEAMRAEQRAGATRFYLVADHRALRRYGLGLVRPSPGGYRRFVRNGYLVQAPTVAALAARLDVDPRMLEATIAEVNRDAAAGVDRRFQKGSNSYNRSMGDPAAAHPCVAPLETPPFYAVRIFTGDLGSAKGLVTDGNARVLRPDGSPIAGLYAVGTDMNSPVGGAYPGAGIVLGMGITFGYIAARSIAREIDALREACDSGQAPTRE
jgi:succinate dehydrogenase/fumarate reductase flavoprotein subunit